VRSGGRSPSVTRVQPPDASVELGDMHADTPAFVSPRSYTYDIASEDTPFV
jgi:hypothetical protein